MFGELTLGLKMAVFGTIVAAIMAAALALVQWGASGERAKGAAEVARQGAVILKDKVRNDAEIQAKSKAELCRELLIGEPTEGDPCAGL